MKATLVRSHFQRRPGRTAALLLCPGPRRHTRGTIFKQVRWLCECRAKRWEVSV